MRGDQRADDRESNHQGHIGQQKFVARQAPDAPIAQGEQQRPDTAGDAQRAERPAKPGTATAPHVPSSLTAPALARRPQPERDAGGLHGLLDHRQQIAGQRVQIHFVALVDTEGCEDAGGIVRAAVEAAVDHGQDAPPRSDIDCSVSDPLLSSWYPLPCWLAHQ